MIRIASLVLISFVTFSEQFSFREFSKKIKLNKIKYFFLAEGIEKCSISNNDCVIKSVEKLVKKYVSGTLDFFE